MDVLKQRSNRNYVIAAGGALVALLAFLLLPYATISENFATSGTSEYVNFTINATALAQGATGISGIFGSQSPLSQSQGGLWFLPILSILALTLIGLLLFRDKPFGTVVNAPTVNQRRWGDFALIGIAAVSILIQIVIATNLNSQVQSYLNANSSSSGTLTGGATGHIGFWLYLLGMVVVGAAVVLMLVQANRQAQATQIASGMPQAQPWQTPPAQPTPPGMYPQQQYPQPQYPQYQTGDQPYQQPSPPQQPSQSSQWPPSNSSQPPY